MRVLGNKKDEMPTEKCLLESVEALLNGRNYIEIVMWCNEIIKIQIRPKQFQHHAVSCSLSQERYKQWWDSTTAIQ